MSSDSDDDSYTNSVSVLKALTNKNISIASPDVSNGVNFFDISSEIESLPPTPKVTRGKQTKNIRLLDDPKEEDVEIVNVTKNNNDSCIILSEDDADVSSVNIISAIDDILQKARGSAKSKGRRKKGRVKRKSSPKQTRQSKKLKQSEKVIQNLDDTDVITIQDTPDINEVNYELTVKVFWKSQNLEKFTMRRFDNLTNIFQHFSEKENTPENRLLFTIKDQIISKNDTPDSLNITAATIIEGGILSAKTNLGSSKSQGDDKLEFKVQMKDRKHPLLISLNGEDRMEVLMCKCAAELNTAVKTLKFYFDGDLIKSSDTPQSLDLEGGEIIDCVKK